MQGWQLCLPTRHSAIIMYEAVMTRFLIGSSRSHDPQRVGMGKRLPEPMSHRRSAYHSPVKKQHAAIQLDNAGGGILRQSEKSSIIVAHSRVRRFWKLPSLTHSVRHGLRASSMLCTPLYPPRFWARVPDVSGRTDWVM
jgi:hypothetical protein